MAENTEIQQQFIDDDYDGEQHRRVRLFAERMFARLPPDLAEEFPAPKRLEIAERGLDFMETRSQPAKVRVFSSPDEQDLLIVETVMPDCSFIVDSILEYFREKQLPVRVMLHPLFRVRRGANGELVTFERGTTGEAIESFAHAEIETAASPELCRTIETDLQRILEAVARGDNRFHRDDRAGPAHLRRDCGDSRVG